MSLTEPEFLGSQPNRSNLMELCKSYRAFKYDGKWMNMTEDDLVYYEDMKYAADHAIDCFGN